SVVSSIFFFFVSVPHPDLLSFPTRRSSDLSDIAVLVSDMSRYRPVLQGVFDREPKRLHYNLADFSAAGISSFGQALLGMLDLALDRKSTRLNSSHVAISYAVFCLKKKT